MWSFRPRMHPEPNLNSWLRLSRQPSRPAQPLSIFPIQSATQCLRQFGDLIRYLKSNVKCIDDAVISVHCHNDLGMAVANSIAAVQAGARQIEGTVNGIGERAGNAAIEEIVMAIKTRSDYFKDFHTEVNAHEIVKSSRLVSRMSGLIVARSKAIVGENAFAHSSGIHQDGILKHRETYEIMDPRDVGWGETELPLTKHSGGMQWQNDCSISATN